MAASTHTRRFLHGALTCGDRARRAVERSEVAAMAAGATPGTWAVGATRSAGAAARVEVPASTERPPVSSSRRRDGATGARVRALGAAAHLRSRQKGGRRHRPVGGSGGAPAGDAKTAAQPLPQDGNSRTAWPSQPGSARVRDGCTRGARRRRARSPVGSRHRCGTFNALRDRPTNKLVSWRAADRLFKRDRVRGPRYYQIFDAS